jgi:hypothetical protein
MSYHIMCMARTTPSSTPYGTNYGKSTRPWSLRDILEKVSYPRAIGLEAGEFHKLRREGSHGLLPKSDALSTPVLVSDLEVPQYAREQILET